VKLRGALALALFLLVVGVVVSRPLATEWADGLPLVARGPDDQPVLTRASGDTLQLYYQLWLVADAVLGPTPLFRDPYQFRFDGPRWNLPQTFLPLAIPFTGLARILGPHAAYNGLVVLSFPLAGLAAAGLVHRYTGRGLAAATAGVIFACLPTRVGPLFGGQPAGFAAPLVPLVLWGIDHAVVRASTAAAAGAGAAFLALAMLEPHYTYLTAGVVLLYVPWRWLTLPAPRPRPLAPLLVFAALALAGAGWLLMLRQAFLVGSVAEAGRSLGEIRLYSAGLAALREPATYGGLAAAGLAAIGLIASGPWSRWLTLFYAVVLATGVLLSLGPTVPGLPVYQGLHQRLPLFALIRNPEKFRLLAGLGATVLAGFGAHAVLTRVPRRTGVVLVLAATVLTCSWRPIGVTRFPDSPIYAALRARAGRVLNLPLFAGDNAYGSVALYTVTRTRVPILNGYSPLVPRRYASDVVAPLQGLNVGELGPAEHALLRRLGVTHVLLDRALFPPSVSPFPSALTRDRLRASTALALETAADPLWLYRVTDGPPTEAAPPASSPVGIFFEAEALSRERGEVVSDPAASGGRAIAVRAGTAAGFLAFGPYQLVPAGEYRARFRVRGSGLVCEITTDEGQTVLGRREPPPLAGWDEVEVTFTVPAAARLEYRVRWDGRGEAAADWVSVVLADRPDPEWTFEVEDLPHKLGERPDPAASGGWAGYAHPAVSLRTGLVSGPARLYPPGAYRLTLRARAEDPATGPVLRLTVTEPVGRILADRAVAGAELAPGRYRDVSLDFRLAVPTVLEFPIEYLGGAAIYLDRLEVTPRPAS
jgi:hypothetical protein